MGRWLAIAFLLWMSGPAGAVEFSPGLIHGKKATICRVKMGADQLQLFLQDEGGRTFKSFEALQRWLAPRGETLVFGMNGGMYHANYAPVGLHVENGRQVAPINLAEGRGNFFLKPNGIFYVSASGAHVVEASQFTKVTEPVRMATQSGPMLVIDGKLHPAFKADSDSRLFRNGVGVATADTAIFVITNEPVNFYEFATFFRDDLRCPNALFLDGTVSSLHSPALKRSDKLIDLGPLIGVVEKRP